MSDFNWKNIGVQIRDAVNYSLQTGDFQQLGDVVSGTVNSALEELRQQTTGAYQGGGNGNRDAGVYQSRSGPEEYGNAGGSGGQGGAYQAGNGGQGGAYQAGSGQGGAYRTGNGGQGGAYQAGNGQGNRAYQARNGGQGGGAYQAGSSGQGGAYRAEENGGNVRGGFRAGQAGQPGQQFYGDAQPRNGNPSGTERVPFVRKIANRIKMRQVGKVSGVLFTVFGGIGTGVMALAILVLGLTLLATGGLQGLLIALCVLLPFLLLFICMINLGCGKSERLKRANRYVQLCGNNPYINISDLALHTGKSEKFVLKDVKKMLKAGMFPEGHLDQEEACLMLDDATYRQYLAIQKERKAREMEEKVARMQAKRSGQAVPGEDIRESRADGMGPGQQGTEGGRTEGGWQDSSAVQGGRRTAWQSAGSAQGAQGAVPGGDFIAREAEPEDPELAAMIREGQDCIRKLRDMNDNIEGEVISAKLFQLENLLKEIFQRVREHPEQKSQMQKFMNYYLPTTLKLVEAYEDFDSVSVPGEDIVQAKEEIEKTLDTINQAFAELLNKLFRDSVFDATTDAQVLQTMLAREGLAKTGEFEKVTR